jgi:hypothetical protein
VNRFWKRLVLGGAASLILLPVLYVAVFGKEDAPSAAAATEAA